MRKIINLLTVFTFAFILTACSSDEGNKHVCTIEEGGESTTVTLYYDGDTATEFNIIQTSIMINEQASESRYSLYEYVVSSKEAQAGNDSGFTNETTIDGKVVTYTMNFNLINLTDNAKSLIEFDEESLKPSNFVETFEAEGCTCY